MDNEGIDSKFSRDMSFHNPRIHQETNVSVSYYYWINTTGINNMNEDCIFHETTRRYISKSCHVYTRSSENLKSHKNVYSFVYYRPPWTLMVHC
jgi:hypothetical protein